MTNQRSPLDGLNMRRERRPLASLDELNRTLSALEDHLLIHKNPTDFKNQQPKPAQTMPDAVLDFLRHEKTSEPFKQAPAENPHKETLAAIAEELQRLRARAELKQAAAVSENFHHNDTGDESEAMPNVKHITAADRFITGTSAFTGSADSTNHTDMIMRHDFEALKRTVETLAREDSLRRMSHRWDALDERFDNFEQLQSAKILTTPLDPALDTIRTRLEDLRLTVEQFPEIHNHSLRQMDERLDEISRAIMASNYNRVQPEQELAVFGELDRRFDELTRHLDEQYHNNTHKTALTDDRFIQALEDRLDHIARQVSEQTATIRKVTVPLPVTAADPHLLQNLEKQLSFITQHLNNSDSMMPELAEIRPRLDSIERTIDINRDIVMGVAREAAEEAIRQALDKGTARDTGFARQFADDLKALEQLTRETDERNSRIFDKVHDTLQRIAERLGQIENDNPNTAAHIVSVAAALPSTDRSATQFKMPDWRQNRDNGPENAAELAAKNPFAELRRSTRNDNMKPRESELSYDAALAPMPDLNAIIRRVRDDQRGHASQPLAETSQSDLISAARRAVQVASDETGRLRNESLNDEHLSSEINAGENSYITANKPRRSVRKPILLALGAIIMAVTGLQLGNGYNAAHNESVAPQTSELDKTPAILPQPIPRIEQPSQPATTALGSKAVATNPPLTSVFTDRQPLPETAGKFNSVTNEVALSLPLSAPDQTTTQSIEKAPQPASNIAIADIAQEAGPVALRSAAANGDALALHEIGMRYMDGRGVSSSFEQAARWYALAAERGFAPAQYRLGNLYEKGLGMPRDLVKARELYERAAIQGNASAMHNLAVLYAMGAEGNIDNDKAAKWFFKAAELGIKDSQYNLGILTAKGLGQAQNFEESYKWFALAANAGDPDAAEKRDQIAKSLKPEQLEHAINLAKLWKPKPMIEAANAVHIPDAWRDEKIITTASVDMKKAVRNIQLILQKNGYDVGSADGLMGDKTRQAIAIFQTANGMKSTGEIDQPLVEALLSKNN